MRLARFDRGFNLLVADMPIRHSKGADRDQTGTEDCNSSFHTSLHVSELQKTIVPTLAVRKYGNSQIFCAKGWEKLHTDNWDDLRYVLCVAQTGSVLSAAKQLGVNHATVLRHVAAFEERHKTTIFERTSQGYRLVPDSAHIIQAAKAAEAAIGEVARLAEGGRTTRSESIRITSTDSLCAYVLPDFVRYLKQHNPEIDIALLSSNTHIDLLREQAHLVVRPAAALGEELVGTAVGELSFAAYARDANADQWLGLTGPIARSVAGKWLAENIPGDIVTSASDSFMTLAALARLGQGIAILPTLIGDQERPLIARPDVMPKLTVPIWVARHVETTETATMKTVRIHLGRFLGQPFQG